MSLGQDALISVVGYYGARPNQVFDAWLNIEAISQFMFGPQIRENEAIDRIEIDPQVGGRFLFTVLRDGKKIDHVGEYFEIKRPLRLSFSWGINDLQNDSRVNIEIIGLGTGSQLTLHHNLPARWASYAEPTKLGWKKILDSLSLYLDN